MVLSYVFKSSFVVKCKIIFGIAYQSLVHSLINLSVFSNQNPIRNRVVFKIVVIKDWFTIGITDYTLNTLDQSLSSTQIPKFNSWNQINVGICFLIKQVYYFIPCTSYSSKTLRLKRPNYFIHTLLIFIHTPYNTNFIISLIRKVFIL